MKKVTLEFTLRQAEEIFHMMYEGSVGWIENAEMDGDHASVRVCNNAIDSFQKQLAKHLREEQKRINRRKDHAKDQMAEK